jgi:Flp pilus assembly protein TadG
VDPFGRDRVRRNDTRSRNRRGTATITVVVALAALIGAGALSIDVGMIWSARTQLQNAADGAALAAALNMIDLTGPTVTIPAAETAAVDNASQNFASPVASVSIDTAEMSFGEWDLDTRTLDTTVDLSIPENVSGVEVIAHLDTTENRPVPAFLSRILGKNNFAVTAQATAYLGFAGKVGPNELDLPIAIDCYKISGPDDPTCDTSYCDTITNSPPNFGDYATDAEGNAKPCHLDDGTPVNCLDLHSSGNQIACWTNLETDQNVNTSDMVKIINSGNPFEVSVGEKYYVDNGTKTPIVQDIYDRFHGQGEFDGNRAGTDVDADGLSHSWVVSLPVIECQEGLHCAKGAMELKGIVCFEIQEVEVTPEKRIKGRFLCKEDVAYKDCDAGLTGTGGDDYDIRADIPVLVR